MCFGRTEIYLFILHYCLVNDKLNQALPCDCNKAHSYYSYYHTNLNGCLVALLTYATLAVCEYIS